MGRIGDRLSVGVLLGLVWAPEIPVRNRAREALEALRSKPGMLGVFAALAQDDDLRTRLHATGYLVRRGDEPWGDFVSACVRTLVSPSSLGWGAVVAAAFAVLGFAWVRVLRPAVVPGLAGWTVLASVWTALWLYWRPSWGWTDGLGILLVLALTPAWAAFAASVAVGGVRWLSARGRMAGYVCRQHYHRFVPGPRLGWIERWTGRLLFKHRGGSAGDLAADTVCRACGQGANYAGVNTVVAVLDNADGRESWFQDGTLRVNWLRYRKPLDFERVEIVRAAETDVEAFVLQSRFQAEEAVRASLSRMLCVVGPEAKLEEKTLRVLRPVFGRVEERART